MHGDLMESADMQALEACDESRASASLAVPTRKYGEPMAPLSAFRKSHEDG